MGKWCIPPNGETSEDKASSDSTLALCDSGQHGDLGYCGKFGPKHGKLSLQFWGWLCLFKNNKH